MKVLFLVCFTLFSVSSYAQLDLGALLEDEISTYGTACGIAGTPPEMRVKIEEHIKHNNLAEIEVWLFGNSQVLKTYAAEAMIRISNTGNEISDKAIQEVLKVKNSSREISICTGCVMETIPIKLALKDYKFELERI